MTASLNEKLRTVKWGKYKTSELFQPQKITNMEWVRRMNSIRNRAEEVVLTELVYA